MTLLKKYLNNIKQNDKYKALLENAQNEKEINNAIDKIESDISSKTREDQLKTWRILYKAYELLPTNESLDNGSFYALMKLKKEKISAKLTNKDK
ncbi:hypothetical protein [Aggregatibacter aphrophilus]|jgi:hypothetical protein|uniref:Uncharacterized protein n=1 Tax=Aggregatibacter aphrophilus TaxID=732 RepID=A0ABX9VUT9_AGGAP|nr:hypothetical protein [Aggregatibacter aphrophilus]RMW85665.1 hypothetical protein DOL88_06260 [Aggregatibacter aphrophilus]